MMRESELPPIPLCIIGPSGCGKSSIARNLVERGLAVISPSWTDRPERLGEEELEHVFVTSREFDQAVSENKFLGVVQPFDLPFRYGLPELSFDQHTVTIVMLRAPFVPTFRNFFPNSPIYQIEASFEFAEAALAKRDDPDQGTRLSGFSKELALGRQVADRILVNTGNDITKLADQLLEWSYIDLI